MVRALVVVIGCFLALNCRSNRAGLRDGPGHRASLVALSLKGAERRAKLNGVGALTSVAGITRLHGLVFDRENRDVILIGSDGEAGDLMSFDDLVVAMRAVLVLHEWPLVSIDSTPETGKTHKQNVRFEGGIAGTGFGQTMLSADVALKKLALGLIPFRELKLLSYFDLCARAAQSNAAEMNGRSRLWFFAMNPALEQREDVFAIRELNVGVRAEAIGSDRGGLLPRDGQADEFAASVTSAYPGLGRQFPEIARLRYLYQVVAVARGMQMMPAAELDYWLKEYRVPKKETLREFPVISRAEQVKTARGVQSLEVAGGVQLEALLVRLEDGDITALKEIVLRSRPSRDAFKWAIPIEKWAWGLSENPVLSAASVHNPGIGTSISRRFVDGSDSGSGKVYSPPTSKPSGTTWDPVTGSFKNAPTNVEIVEPGSSTLTRTQPSNSAQPPKTAAARQQELKDEIVRMVNSVLRQPPELKPILNYRDGAYYTNDGGKTNYQKDSTLGYVSTDGGKTNYLKDSTLGYESNDGGKTNYVKNSTLKPQPTGDSAGKGANQPANSASGGGGFLCLSPSCVGPVQDGPDGMHAKPFVEGGQNGSGQRYLNAGYRVYSGDRVIETVQGDVKLIGNGLYAKRDNTSWGYRVIDSTSGKQVSGQYTDLQPVGGGYFSVPTSTAGFGMRDIVDSNMKVVYSYPANEVASYMGDGRVKLRGLNDQYIDLPKTQSPADSRREELNQPASSVHQNSDPNRPVGGISLGSARDIRMNDRQGWKPPNLVRPSYSTSEENGKAEKPLKK